MPSRFLAYWARYFLQIFQRLAFILATELAIQSERPVFDALFIHSRCQQIEARPPFEPPAAM